MKTMAMKKIAGNKFAPRTRAFTLMELTFVIGIIVTLAAFTIPVLHSVKRRGYIEKTQAELAKLETAIESYKAAYGFYPPSNPNSPLFNPLYYELLGTTNNNGTYYTLDGSASIAAGSVSTALGIGGFMNCSKPGAGDEAPVARSFIQDLKPNQIGTPITNAAAPTTALTLLLGSVGGPDLSYQPLGVADVNPWRYNSSNPTNNPNGYDLWIDFCINGTTNRVSNWNRTVQLNP
jgi:type II secretory pathway pseudopilin PulG